MSTLNEEAGMATGEPLTNVDDVDGAGRQVTGAGPRPEGAARLEGIDLEQLTDDEAIELSRSLAERSEEAGNARYAAQQGALPKQPRSPQPRTGPTPENMQDRTAAARRAPKRVHGPRSGERAMRRAGVLVLAGAMAASAAGCGGSSHEVGLQARKAPTTRAGAPSGPSTAAPTTSTTVAATTSTTVAATTSTTANPYGGVNRTDATAVSEAMLQANFTSNTTTDSSPFDATKRALIWYTPAGAAQVLASAPTGSPGAEWETWTQHKVTTKVTIQINTDPGAPPDTATAADRQFNVSVTPTGAGGWTSAPDTYQCFVTLSRADADSPWQVADLQTDT